MAAAVAALSTTIEPATRQSRSSSTKGMGVTRDPALPHEGMPLQVRTNLDGASYHRGR
jgi:hypothetical protein